MLDYNKFLNMEPGKYWKLPENKKQDLDKYLEHKDYIPMIKYDGYWARIIITDKEVFIQSRGISTVTKTYGEYQDKVPHIVNELKQLYPAGTVLLGELCYADLSKTATDVGSILRSLSPRAVKLQENDKDKLSLMIFDCLAYAGTEIMDRPFWNRFSSSYIKEGLKYVHKAITGAEAKKLLFSVWEQGGEGIILINKEQPYNIGGAKAWHSIKVKREIGEIEAKVIGIIEPTREYVGDNPEGWQYKDDTGALVTKAFYFGRKVGVVVEYQGRRINISSGITDEDGQYLATVDAQNLIQSGNLYAVFTGMEITEDSVRHPRLIRLRDDI